MPCHKIDINNDEEDKEEWVTQGDEEQNSILRGELGKQKHKTSTQYSSKANQECGTDEALDFDQGLTKRVCKSASLWKAFIKFCSSEMFPKGPCPVLAFISSMIQFKLFFTLGHADAYENLLRNDTILLSLGQASTQLLPAILWNVMFIVSFVYAFVFTVPMVPSASRVPVILMLCLFHLCGLWMWVAEASTSIVICCGSFKMNGILFASLGVLDFILLSLVLVMLVLFASWRKQGKGVR